MNRLKLVTSTVTSIRAGPEHQNVSAEMIFLQKHQNITRAPKWQERQKNERYSPLIFVLLSERNLFLNLFTYCILTAVENYLCLPQATFFPIIKVSPQFLIKGISSIKSLILRIYKI